MPSRLDNCLGTDQLAQALKLLMMMKYSLITYRRTATYRALLRDMCVSCSFFRVLFHDVIITAACASLAQLAVLNFGRIDVNYLHHPITEYSHIAPPFIKLSGVMLWSDVNTYITTIQTYSCYVSIHNLTFVIFDYVTLEYLYAMEHCYEFIFYFRNTDGKCRLPQTVKKLSLSK
jgi:hypothetical protein